MIGSRVVAAAAVALGIASVASTPSPAVRLYHDNPDHLWNRLHAALFVRVAADGREYGGDRVDPLLWIGSKYLLRGPSHEKAIALLTEFVDSHGERLIDDPVKRAMLQRDLWAVFDWLEGDHGNFEKPSLSAEDVRAGARPLRGPLATAIARLALTPPQIAMLPDNLAGASDADGAPRDLFAAGGPWVNVGRPDGPMARLHLGDAGPGKNSVFLVLLRLPDGREATLTYLERLRAFNGPLWIDDPGLPRSLTPYPNPDVPQFPAGTQVALVRRALVIDSTGNVSPTRLTVSVQLRVYRSIEKMTAETFADVHRVDESMFPRAGQDFEEFTLNRAALVAGRPSLLPMAAAGPFFLTFSAQGFDPFEMRLESRQLGMEPERARQMCNDCHAAPGIYSVNSFVPFRMMNGPNGAGAPKLSGISLADAERTAVSWKQQRPEWIALKRLSFAAPQADTGQASIQERLKRVGVDLFSGADRVNESIRELKAILAVDPRSAEAHFLLGIAYGRLGSTELMGEATAEFRQALSLNPSLVQARYYLAQVYLNLGRAQRAREELDAALVQVPGHPQFLALLGEAERQLGHPQRSIEVNQQALQVDPSFTQARYYSGLAMLDLGRRDEAIRELERVAQSGPELAEVYLSLGSAYLDAGRVDEALDALRHGNRIDPARPDIRIRLARAYRSRGLLGEAEEQLKLAESAGRTALASPVFEQVESDLYLEQGLVKLQQGRLDAAAKAFKKVLDRDTNNGPANRFIAEVYLLQGLYTLSFAHATRAEKLGFPLPEDKRKLLQEKLHRKETRQQK